MGQTAMTQRLDKTMGVAEYQLVRALPKPLDTCLPALEVLESELSRELGPETPA